MAVASSASASDLTSVIIDMNSITGHELDALTEGESVYCVLCRKDVLKAVSVCVVKAKKDTHHDVWNCKGCKRLKERINEFQRTNEYFKMFHQISKEKKAEFFQKSHLLMGRDLSASLTDTIAQMQTESSELVFTGTGDWLDEADLRQKYESKPDVLERILKLAKTMDDAIKGKLYQDTHFQSKSIDTQKFEKNVCFKRSKKQLQRGPRSPNPKKRLATITRRTASPTTTAKSNNLRH